jgi:hypothetical protein
MTEVRDISHILALIFYLISFDECHSPGAARGAVRSLYTRKRVCVGSDAECPICIGAYAVGTYQAQLRCEHVFHQRCLTRWLNVNPSCPLCRLKLM